MVSDLLKLTTRFVGQESRTLLSYIELNGRWM
jgi:hypothetical protein